MSKLLKKVLSTAFLTFTLSALTSTSALANETAKLKKYTKEDVIQLLKNEGYGDVQSLGENTNAILFRANGKPYLTLITSVLLQVRSVYTDHPCSLTKVNKFNNEYDLGRARIDHENGYCQLDMVLLLDEGQTDKQVKSFYKAFLNAVVPIFEEDMYKK